MTDAQVAGGHKAVLSNPNTSQEAKEHSKEVLEKEFNIHTSPNAAHDDQQKNPSNVAAGLKAAINNPNVSEEAKESARERLDDMEGNES